MKNKPASQLGQLASVQQAGLCLPVVETFHSLQGEGVWTGTNAFFIRLAGCDVGCPFCDTKESWNPRRHPQRLVAELVAAAQSVQPGIVVVTGGEPLMHDLSGLVQGLRNAGLRSHLETSGAYPYTTGFDWITLSPKPLKPPHSSIYPAANELKVVVSKPEDFTWAEQQATYVSPTTIKLLQPEWNTPTSQSLIVDYILHHPEWRLSLQTHKLLGVR